MKHFLIIISLVIISLTAVCQVSNYTDVYVQKKFFNELYQSQDNAEIEIEGSPYYSDEFSEGKVKMGSTTYIIPLRYNIYFDAFEAKLEQKDMYLNNVAVDTVYLNNSVFTFKKENNDLKAYEVVFHSNKIELLKKHAVKFKPGSFGVPFKADVYPNFKKTDPKYFMVTESNKMIPFTSYKSLYNAFPEKKDLIMKEIKSGKLKKKKDKDLQRLFSYVSSIL